MDRDVYIPKIFEIIKILHKIQRVINRPYHYKERFTAKIFKIYGRQAKIFTKLTYEKNRSKWL